LNGRSYNLGDRACVIFPCVFVCQCAARNSFKMLVSQWEGFDDDNGSVVLDYHLNAVLVQPHPPIVGVGR
jgi:hypothetical protein